MGILEFFIVFWVGFVNSRYLIYVCGIKYLLIFFLVGVERVCNVFFFLVLVVILMIYLLLGG